MSCRIRSWPLLVAGFLPLAGTAAHAEDRFQAVRPEAFVSSDADGSEVQKWGLGWDVSRRDREHWIGLKAEQARFAGPGFSHSEQRLYLRAAGTFGPQAPDDDSWRWQVSPGTNGDAVLGSASLHTEGERRKEVFLERELLETRQGVADGQVVTFLGGAIDQPLGDRWSSTGLLGLQDFDDDNLRTHLRGTLVYALMPEAGISLQLRSRYYRNSEPFAGDYFSPPWYGEALGAVGLRRFVGGHQYRAVMGYGRQRDSGQDWKRARLLQVGYESPRWRNSWLRVDAGYTDTPVSTSDGSGSYSYRYVMLEAVIEL